MSKGCCIWIYFGFCWVVVHSLCGGSWRWIYFGWWWMVGGGGGYILAGGELWWVVDIIYIEVGGGGWFQLVLGVHIV